MGHPLSFAILCAINLSVYHHSIRLWVRDSKSHAQFLERKRLARIMWRQVIVNGDDMLFKCT
jgi:hypothetical protein